MKTILESQCACLSQPYGEVCTRRATSNCKRCGIAMCFDHGFYHASWEKLCPHCFKEITKPKP